MKTEDDEIISNLIKKEMKKLSITGRDLADKLGVSESMICLLLQSRRKWSPKYIDKLYDKKVLDSEQLHIVHKHSARSYGFRV